MVDPKTRSSDGGAAKQAKSLPPPAPTTRPGLLFKTSGMLNGKHDDVEKHSSCCFRHVAHLAEKALASNHPASGLLLASDKDGSKLQINGSIQLRRWPTLAQLNNTATYAKLQGSYNASSVGTQYPKRHSCSSA
ncbi:hypothetical protein AOLI_G00186280 [Acnodon oligacanthus]